MKRILDHPLAKHPFAKKGAAIVGVILALWVVTWMFSDGEEENAAYQTAILEKGPLKSSISATGTLSALVTVQVGSQLSGQLNELHVDFNSSVKKGQVIARIDPATFETKVTQTEAELAIAKANVLQAAASVREVEAALEEAKRVLARSEKLRASRNIPESQLDTAKAEAEKAEARLASAQAQIITANAQVKQREASLKSALVDLERTYIRSPVDGVVIGRDIDIGQTVAASLQAPILFTIAQDLAQMQLEVRVDEADIGQIKDGQQASFSVDAYPEEEFTGFVKQIRKAPQVEQNVVTYTVIVSADNADQRLLPGMTANVEIISVARDSVLKIPNRALRFRPQGQENATMRRPRSRPSADGPPQERSRPKGAPIWVLDEDGDAIMKRVVLGISDGTYSELASGDVKEGDAIIVGQGGPGQPSQTRRRRFGFF